MIQILILIYAIDGLVYLIMSAQGKVEFTGKRSIANFLKIILIPGYWTKYIK